MNPTEKADRALAAVAEALEECSNEVKILKAENKKLNSQVRRLGGLDARMKRYKNQ
jgi:cell division protein FtsB